MENAMTNEELGRIKAALDIYQAAVGAPDWQHGVTLVERLIVLIVNAERERAARASLHVAEEYLGPQEGNEELSRQMRSFRAQAARAAVLCAARIDGVHRPHMLALIDQYDRGHDGSDEEERDEKDEWA